MNYKVFKNKKVAIFIPHQDDEINIVYGLLYEIKNIAKEIKVIYSTNGNYIVNDKLRLKECIESLRIVGLSKENIIFMGYSDQIPEESTHLYHENTIWYDKRNNYLTSTPFNNDYHFSKYKEHAIFNKINFINDLKDIICDYKADIVISIDLDSHPDHRALSLALENALGQIFKISDYRPIVLKAFAYPTSYKGYSDFNYNNYSTRFLTEKNSICEMQNPYYNWSERIIFKNSSKATAYLFLKNIYFYGLLKHKSQYILNQINRVINNDLVFFERNTNNLLFDAIITTSSGDAKYLNDFMLFDSKNIMGGVARKMQLDNGFTILEKKDIEKNVKIKFLDEKKVDIINIYVKPEKKSIIKSIDIKVNGKLKKVKYHYQSFTYVFNDLNLDNVNLLEIIFSCEDDVYIGEIEVLESKDNIKYAWLEIENNVYNDYYCNNIPVVSYRTNVVEKGKFKIVNEKNKFELMYDGEVIDQIKIHKLCVPFLKCLRIINEILLFGGRIYQKIVKEIRKILYNR